MVVKDELSSFCARITELEINVEAQKWISGIIGSCPFRIFKNYAISIILRTALIRAIKMFHRIIISNLLPHFHFYCILYVYYAKKLKSGSEYKVHAKIRKNMTAHENIEYGNISDIYRCVAVLPLSCTIQNKQLSFLLKTICNQQEMILNIIITEKMISTNVIKRKMGAYLIHRHLVTSLRQIESYL